MPILTKTAGSSIPSDKITLIPSNQLINYGIVYAIPYQIFYITGGLVYHLDAGNSLSYSGSGSTWTDLTGSGISMTLYGSPVYSSANGGYLSFVPSSSQYGSTSTSLAATSTWTIEAFIYYNGTNTGGLPCIFTDTYPGTSSSIQWALGSLAGGGNTALQAGYFSGGWFVTPAQTPLTSGNWYHVVGTYDGTNIKLYINGSLNQTTASSTAPVRNAGVIVLCVAGILVIIGVEIWLFYAYTVVLYLQQKYLKTIQHRKIVSVYNLLP